MSRHAGKRLKRLRSSSSSSSSSGRRRGRSGRLSSLLDDRAEGVIIDEIHEKQGLEDSVGELGSLSEQFRRATRICHG